MAALSIGPHRIGTLISMAADSSHRAKMGEHLVSTLALSVFYRIFFVVAGTCKEDNHNSLIRMSKKEFRMSKSDIRSQLEYQKSIPNIKV